MPHTAQAYDFDRFGQSALPAHSPEQKPGQKRRHNVVELPQRELKRNARAKRSPLRMVLSALFFAGVMFTVMTVIYSQVQLTELTEEINQTTQALEEAESLEIQLNMAAAQKMTGAQVEEYAVNELGMSKITGSQVTYVNVAQEDQGTVVEETDSASLLDQILATVRSWFA